MAVDQGVLGVAEAPAAPLAPPHRWTDTSPHPWRRYFARMVDLVVVGSPALFVFAVILSLVAPTSMGRVFADPTWSGLLATIFAGPAAAPINALTIGRNGGSLGKWIFGVKVVGSDGRPIGFRRALVRELDIWTRGMGLSLPLVSFITMLNAYGKLTEERRTVWDKARNNTILHRPWGPRDQVIGAVVVAALVALTVLSRFSG